MTIDLTKRALDGNYALYLPAISSFYAKHLGGDLADPTFIPPERVPRGFELGIQGVNFLDPEKSYYHYGRALYSAGHAELKLDKCEEREPMIHRRDRERTVLVGDSGGFQIATGVLKLDWSQFKGPEGDRVRERILRYLEHTADWSMTLDIPAFAADPPLSKKTGLTRFEDTLDLSEHNLHYFLKNRVPGKTRFLNVLSGSTRENSQIWFDAVKKFSQPDQVEAMGYSRDRTLEGWAFAGINAMHMPSTLTRVLDLKEAGLLEGKDWIHVLGIGRLDWSCYLTSLMRAIRRHYNPNITISFDAASPFVAAGGYALSYNYNHFDSNRLTYSMDRGLDDKTLKGSQLAMVHQSPINDRLTVGDICYMGVNDANKQGKIGKTSWDSTSYLLVMAHNVYNHVQAVQETLRLADIEYHRFAGKSNFRNWTRQKRMKLSEFIPSNILFFNNFVEELLDPNNPDPRGMLADNMAFLETISFGGISNQSRTREQMNQLFDWSAIGKNLVDEQTMAETHNVETDRVLSRLDKMTKPKRAAKTTAAVEDGPDEESGEDTLE